MFEGGPAATPTIDGERLYTVGHRGELFCLETATGKKLWQKHYQDELGGRRPQWGFSGSPTVEGNLVILDVGGAGSSTVALDKAPPISHRIRLRSGLAATRRSCCAGDGLHAAGFGKISPPELTAQQ